MTEPDLPRHPVLAASEKAVRDAGGIAVASL